MAFLLKLLRFWVLLVFIALAVYVGLSNQEPVGLSLPGVITHITVPAWQALMGFWLLGATVVIVFFGIDHVKKSFEIRRLRRRLESLEASLSMREPSPVPAQRTSGDVSPIG